MKRAANAILIIVTCAFWLWFIASFVEINSKNLRPNPTYHEYNFFIVLDRIGDSFKEK